MNLEQIKTTWAIRRAARFQHDPQTYRNWAIALGVVIFLVVLAVLTWTAWSQIRLIFLTGIKSLT